jgi:hypothetical protein
MRFLQTEKGNAWRYAIQFFMPLFLIHPLQKLEERAHAVLQRAGNVSVMSCGLMRCSEHVM